MLLKKKVSTVYRKKIALVMVFCMLLTSFGFQHIVKADAINGLIGYWAFDEGTGSTAADSVSSSNGAVTKANWVDGKYGKALDFNGTDSRVDVTTPLNSVDNLTIAMWVNMRSFINSYNALITTNGWQAGALGFIIDGVHKNLSFQIDGNASQADPVWGTVASNQNGFDTDKLNSWHHVAVTYNKDAKTVSFYIDGVLDSTAVYQNANSADLSGFEIGAWSWLGKNFDGLIDDVQIYIRDLSSAEIAQVYSNAPSVQNQPPKVANVTITGTAVVGQTVTGNYTYNDPESDVQGIPTFQWYRGTAADGSNKTKITGATAQTYTLETADSGQYIFFEVTPVAQTGTVQGTPVVSAPILAGTVSNPPSDTIPTTPAGIIADWTFDKLNPDGTVKDSINNVIGTLKGGAALAGGKFSQGLKLSNFGDYVQVTTTNSTFKNLDALSIGMWVNMDSTSISQNQSILLSSDWSWDYVWQNSTHALQWNIPWNSNTMNVGVIGNSSSFDPTYGGSSSRTDYSMRTILGNWHHLAITYDTTSKKVSYYVDGQFISEAFYDTAVSADLSNFQIGDWNWDYPASRTFKGTMDELQLYNRVLSAEEISLLYRYAPPIPNFAPTAANVNITGIATVGQALIGNYTYSDTENDVEGTSTYQWYRGTVTTGTDKTPISGATSKTYTLTSEDQGNYIFFEVTPVAQSGITTGSAVVSTPVLLPAGDKETYPTLSSLSADIAQGKFAPVGYASSVELDGNFDKWKSFTGISLPSSSYNNQINNWGGPSDCSGEAYFAYNASTFYLAVKATDDVHYPIPGGSNWSGDGIQFAFAEGAFRTEFGVALGTDGTADIQRYSAGQAILPASAIQMHLTQSGNDTIYELAIPWTAVMAHTPVPGEKVPFTVLINDNDGSGRKGYIQWTDGIGGSKDVGKLASVELLPQAANWSSWLAGPDTVNSGDITQYTLYVPNFSNETRNLKLDIPAYGVSGQDISIPAGKAFRKTFSVTLNSNQDIAATIKDPVTGETKTEKISVAAVLSAEELSTKFEDIQANVLPRLKSKLNLAKDRGLSTDYETVNVTVIENFIQFGKDDINNNRLARAQYIVNTLYNLDQQAEDKLDSYIAGTAAPFTVPQYITGKTTIDGYSMIGNTTEGQRPIIFTGYGMFDRILGDVAKFPSYGTNIVDYNFGPTYVINEPTAFQDWSSWSAANNAIFTLDSDPSNVHSGTYAAKYTSVSDVSILVQTFNATAGTTYNFTGWVKGQGASPLLYSKNWAFSTGLPSGDSWQRFSAQVTADSTGSLEMGFFQNGAGTIWLDDLSVSAVGSDTNLLKNGDFEAVSANNDFIVNTSNIENTILPFLKNAEDKNVAVNLDLAMHYWPLWTYDKWPDLLAPDNLFANRFDIENPIFWEIEKAFLDTVVPLIKDSPALQAVTLSSEPIYYNNAKSVYHQANWHNYLKDHFATVAEMNNLYGTSYASFDDVPVPDVTKVTGTPLYYDYLTFKTSKFTELSQRMADEIHKFAPNLPVHIKTMGWGLLNRDPLLTWGMNPEALNGLSQISDTDDGNSQELGPQGYLDCFNLYDLESSLHKQPVFNSEDHIITDGYEVYTPQVAESVGNTIWGGALHGRTLSTIWVWDRSYDTVNQGYLQGSILNRPDAVVQVGKAALDLNRLAYEVTAFQNAPANVALFYSFTSNLYSTTYFDTLKKAYNALSNSQQKAAYISENMINDLVNSPLDKYKVLVLPEVTNLSPATLTNIKNWEARGGKVISIGTAANLLKGDEHNQPLSETDRNAILTSANTISVASNPTEATLKATFFNVLDQLGLDNVIVYDAATNLPVEDMECRTATYNNQTLLSLLNYSESNRSVYVKVNGVRVTPAKELISDVTNTSSTLAVAELNHYIYVLPAAAPEITLSSASLTSSSANVEIGNTTQLTLTGLMSDNTAADLTNASVNYTSSRSDVATVDNNGVVTAIKAGSTDITANVTLNGVTVTTGKVTITVKPILSSATISVDKTTLYVNETVKLTTAATMSDNTAADLTNATVNYTSSRSDVATVDNNGVITAFKVGSTDITATVTMNGRTLTTNKITITVVTLTSVTMKSSDTKIEIGETVQLMLEGILNDNTSADLRNVTVKYTSSRPDVAIVDTNGVVTVLKSGVTDITATVTVYGLSFTSNKIKISVSNSKRNKSLLAD